jgi:sterol desaturase/sphingolipid hydroxylase (fatty acid hydroxylase superfamily)
MHRVHHSVDKEETNSNFGFNLPWWDRLFGTYRAQPRRGHEKMIIGLQTFRDPRLCLSLGGMLGLPFRGTGLKRR